MEEKEYVVSHECSCGSFTAVVKEAWKGRWLIRRTRTCTSCPKTKCLKGERT